MFASCIALFWKTPDSLGRWHSFALSYMSTLPDTEWISVSCTGDQSKLDLFPTKISVLNYIFSKVEFIWFSYTVLKNYGSCIIFMCLVHNCRILLCRKPRNELTYLFITTIQTTVLLDEHSTNLSPWQMNHAFQRGYVIWEGGRGCRHPWKNF